MLAGKVLYTHLEQEEPGTQATAQLCEGQDSINHFWKLYLLGLYPVLLAGNCSLNFFPNVKLEDFPSPLFMCSFYIRRRKKS